MIIDSTAIRTIMREKRLTYKAAAGLAGLSEGGLRRIVKSGTCYPFTANAIAAALDVPLGRIRRKDNV